MGKILKNSKEFFDNMTDQEFESLLDDMGVNYTKVKPGEGGITHDGKLYKTYEEFDRATRVELGCITCGRRQCKTCDNFIFERGKWLGIFDICKVVNETRDTNILMHNNNCKYFKEKKRGINNV